MRYINVFQSIFRCRPLSLYPSVNGMPVTLIRKALFCPRKPSERPLRIIGSVGTYKNYLQQWLPCDNLAPVHSAERKEFRWK